MNTNAYFLSRVVRDILARHTHETGMMGTLDDYKTVNTVLRWDLPQQLGATEMPGNVFGSLPEVQFVNRKLSEAEIRQFDEWLKEVGDDWSERVVDLLVAGYKYSSSRDAKDLSYIVTFTCWTKGSPNYARAMTTRSDIYWRALQMAVYKLSWLWKDLDWDTIGKSPTEG